MSIQSRPFVFDTLSKKTIRNTESILQAKLGDSDSVQQTPGVVLAVIPFHNKVTFKYDVQQSFLEKLKADSNATAMATRGVWQIQNLCTEVSVTHSKGSHVGNLRAVLVDVKEEIYYNVSPGDWIFCWMTDNHHDYKLVSQQVLEMKERANGFMSGLKFVGRVQSIRRTTTVGENGVVRKRVNIEAVSFSELNSAVYWNPALSIRDDPTNQSWLGVAMSTQNISEFISDISPRLERMEEALLVLLTMFLGHGVPKWAKNPGARPETVDDPVLQRTPNEAYLIPAEVGLLLGISTTRGDWLRYSDLIHVVTGRQTYSEGRAFPDFNPKDELVAGLKGFVNAGNFYLLKNRLIGRMSPVSTPWANVPIWQILGQYANLEANEMYTTLRATPLEGGAEEFRDDPVMEGTGTDIQPWLVLRQQPYTTDLFKRHSKVTRFSELPRWLVKESQVMSEDLGRSDALRCNFTSVVAMPSGLSDPDHSIENANRNQSPPISDSVDIRRSGLRPLISTINVDTLLGAIPEAAGTETPTAAPTTEKGIPKPTMERIGIGNFQLVTEAAAAFKEMAAAAKKAGLPAFQINNTYRSYDQQLTIWKQRMDDPNNTPDNFLDDKTNEVGKKEGPVAIPGTSPHEKGIAIDFVRRSLNAKPNPKDYKDFEPNDTHKWLTANASKFGFRQDSREYWHWEYSKTISPPRDPFAPPDFTGSKPASLPVTKEQQEMMDLSLHWSSLIADFRMGGHLRETGTLVVHGLQCPIPVGDNLQYRGCIYHIESITHRCSKSADGKVQFTTQLALANGTRIARAAVDEILDDNSGPIKQSVQFPHQYPYLPGQETNFIAPDSHLPAGNEDPAGGISTTFYLKGRKNR